MKHRHFVLLAFASLAVLTYFDRLCIAIAGPRIQADLGFSPEQWGWIVGIFAVSYGALEIPTGALGDRFGQRAVITRIVLWWSAFTALTGSVSSFRALLAVRFLFGAGEAGAFPNIAGALSRWFPSGERARAQGVVWSASRVGGILAPLLLVPLMTALGWRAAFWTLGVAGVIWIALWRPWYRNWPADHPRISAAELRELEHPKTPMPAPVPWRALFRSRALWVIVSMYWSYGWGAYFYLSWLHSYLVNGRGLTEREMGLYSTLPFLLGACANLAGGWLSDRMVRRFGLKNGRRLVGSASLAAASVCILATALVPGKWWCLALISAGYGCMDLMLPSAWAICLDVGGCYAGAVTGAMNSSAQFGGFLCSVLFGYLVRWFGSYDAPLFAIAAMLLASAWLFSRIDAENSIL